MKIGDIDLNDATKTQTYDYIRNNPRHLFQRYQDITGAKLSNGLQPSKVPPQAMQGVNQNSQWGQ